MEKSPNYLSTSADGEGPKSGSRDQSGANAYASIEIPSSSNGDLAIDMVDEVLGVPRQDLACPATNESPFGANDEDDEEEEEAMEDEDEIRSS